MSTDINCPIWGTKATEHDADGEDGRRIDSPRAGGCYFISAEAEEKLRGCDTSVKARLTTWLNDQRRWGVDCPKVDAGRLDDSRKRPRLPVYQQAYRLLRFLASQESHPGSIVWVPGYDETAPEDLPLALSWVESSADSSYEGDWFGEIEFFMRYLEQQGWVSNHSPGDPGSMRRQLTVDGHARLAELEKPHIPSTKAFVAMSFDASMDDAFEDGIKLGIRDAGYEPIRIDRKQHINRIDDEIMTEIRRSRFVVADLTPGDKGACGGVYFEAGFAMGLNIQVIYCCRKDKSDDVHFNVRQYNRIEWESAEDLRRQLTDCIAEVIRDGPHKKPPDHDHDPD